MPLLSRRQPSGHRKEYALVLSIGDRRLGRPARGQGLAR